MPVNLNSFMAPGYPGNEVDDQVFTPSAVGGDERGATPAYRVQPAVWLWVILGLAVIGLYFFLED